jgi:hypothetical protein
VETQIFAAVCIVAIVAGWLAWTLYRKNRELNRRLGYRARTWPAPAAIKSPEQERAEHLDRQLLAVIQHRVTFYRRRVMNRGEYDLFRAALGVTGQAMPNGPFPFYVFPQVALGQIIGTERAGEPDADEAHRAINSKRCDLLIADRNGNPIAVLELPRQRPRPRRNRQAARPDQADCVTAGRRAIHRDQRRHGPRRDTADNPRPLGTAAATKAAG